MTALNEIKSDAEFINTATVENSALIKLPLRAEDDIENCCRRNNLPFFGIHDSGQETWVSLKNKVKAFVSGSLGLHLVSDAIAKAHSLGKFTEEERRPMIVRFTHF